MSVSIKVAVRCRSVISIAAAFCFIIASIYTHNNCSRFAYHVCHFRPFSKDDKLGVHMVQNDEEGSSVWDFSHTRNTCSYLLSRAMFIDGEINLVNSKYATTRFAFSWSWWSAYGWQVRVRCPASMFWRRYWRSTIVRSQRRQKSNADLSEGMKLIAQPDCYNAGMRLE